MDWPLGEEARETSRIEIRDSVTRLSQLLVNAPYDQCELQVLRKDRTLAADPCNRFVALPSRALKGPALAVLNASGKLGSVVAGSSSAVATRTLELTVTSLRLDCTAGSDDEARRTAEASVSLLVLDAQRAIVGAVQGYGTADAKSGDYGAAFAEAFAKALEGALRRL